MENFTVVVIFLNVNILRKLVSYNFCQQTCQQIIENHKQNQINSE